MKQLQTYTYKPRHQREGEPEVEFELRPITQRVYLTMLIDSRGDMPGPDGTMAAVEYAVVGWKGFPKEFSNAARRELFDGEPNPDAALWAVMIAGECYRRVHVKVDEGKNS